VPFAETEAFKKQIFFGSSFVVRYTVLGSHAEETVLHLGGVTISVETIGWADRLLGGFGARARIAGGMTKTSNIQSRRGALAIKETNRISR
jgi:hypothetical protein